MTDGPAAHRPVPESEIPYVGDPYSVERIRHALLDEPMSLLAALRDERPAVDPLPGTAGLLARGEAHLIFSERGQGKSLVSLILGLSAAARGERVLILDRENGDAVTAARVRDIVAARPEWAGLVEDGQLVGSHWPHFSSDWFPPDVAAALKEFTFVVLDSMRELVSELSGKNNNDDTISAIYSLLVTPLRERGAAVVLLDNTGHDNTHRPKGAGGKMDAAPTLHKVVTVSEFTPDSTGEIEIHCTRSRHGQIGRVWRMRVGGGVYEVPHEPTVEGFAAAQTLRVEVLQTALTVLGASPFMGRDHLIRAIRELGVKGRSDVLREHLTDLASDPATSLMHDPQLGFHRGERQA